MNRFVLRLLISIVVLSLVPQRTSAAESTPQGIPYGVWEAEHLGGDWGGIRTDLAQHGVSLNLTYTADFLGNPVGGHTKAFRYASGLEIGMRLDLELILGTDGLVFDITGDYRAGLDLSEPIGNFFPPAQSFGVEKRFGRGSMHLYRFSLEQLLLDERLSILVGRIGMGDDFLTSDLYANFVQTAFNANPVGVVANLPGFSIGPVSTWGWRVRYREDRWCVMGGVYYADETLGEDDKHGVDFSIRRDKGLISILQVAYRHNQAKRDMGLPGEYYVGSYYDSNRFEGLGDPTKARHGNYGLYFHMGQMVFAEAGSDRQEGLRLFLAGTFAPFTEINLFPYFVMGGAVYQGLIPGRKQDKTSFGAAYGQVSASIPGQTYELIFELNHNFQVTPWFNVQPDIQYILRPGGTGDIPDAVVMGWQMQVNF